MATLWRVVMLTVGIVCLERGPVSANEMVEEMKERLSSIEANQLTMRQSLRNLQTEHVQDVSNVTSFCQGMKETLKEQGDLLDNVKQALQNIIDDCVNESLPIADQNGPCNPDNHSIIDDDWRAINGEYNGYNDQCDNDMQAGWYRFLLHSKSGQIPTECVPENHCQTDAPTWVDLQGQSPPSPGEQIDARACSHWDDDCCNWQAPIAVRNCGDFFVYRIQPLVTCDLAFCVIPHA